MQNKQMTVGDTVGLGFMTFAFFLGAGNLIFPPFAGHLAGDNTLPAMIGFLLTAVGMPLIGLIAVAKSNGKVMNMLPAAAATALAVSIYLIIGPIIAAPRTGLVAFEIGALPFLSDSADVGTSQLIYTLCFFMITLVLSAFPGKLLDSVGKVLTPVLIFLLVGLAVSVFVLPGAEPGLPQGEYASSPLTKGVLEGYNTMDTLASLIFGMLIIDILRKKGVTDPAKQTKYLVRAALIAASGLAFVYLSLFYLGTTAGDLAKGATTGGQLLTQYVTYHFGSTGIILLAGVVTLACLTTAVGLVSACSEYFNELLPKISYRAWVLLMCAGCMAMANLGLKELINFSIPVLVTVYPVAIALVLVTFLTNKYTRPAFSHRLVLGVALVFGLFDGLKVAGVDTGFLSFMPLYAEGMAWLLPTVIAMIACLFIKGSGTSGKVA
ncbi:branched-chain amino acid transport system II carrier protein [Shewanella sp. GXUN23E]|uniref:branched-chain amino acid transport system II carrier protein n=1 Tax=Shewanella sp. GXUN23E TaxID=3422498 RepID=UPI003D7DF7E9